MTEPAKKLSLNQAAPGEDHAAKILREKIGDILSLGNTAPAKPVAAHVAAADQKELEARIIAALQTVYDPEIPLNIYDLGLIYGVDISPEGHAAVQMTLTTPHCPVAESMPAEVELRVGSVPGVGHAEVNLVWDPPWDPQKMSDDAKLELGML